ncbi:hypothetical protein HUG17_8003 [Dermatophagoides farinae]|uniref:Chitin-binding type-2 domain-containing protein n=1 Tax=Dermatophagoides farinae TaxID=6954 RepID=A0A9D4SG63_DERFA|nr:hypothetical protein HUG17_8003 [Dermatophagoides farinae]
MANNQGRKSSIGTLIDCRRQPQPQPSTITERSKFIDDNDSIDYFNINNNNNNKYSDEIDEEFDDFDCPEKFGYYPDEKNCSKYHLCDHGKSRLKSCDDGLVFSTILKTCDWPYNVHCNLANGDRGDFVGRHLRLRNNAGTGDVDDNNNKIDQSLSNRRQPVLSNEADDSYWLGRPNTDLLAYLNDDNDYHDIHHEEFHHDFDIPRRPVLNNQNRLESHRSLDDETENNKRTTTSNDDQPWFQNVNFDQRRPTTTTTTTTSTSSQPIISINQRGNQGWRSTTPAINTQTTRTPTMLPRKALRFGDNGEQEDFLVTDGGANRHVPDNDLGDYRRKPAKNDRDSYRIVSFQQQNPITTTTPQTTTTTTTTRSQPIWFQQTTPPPTTAIQTATQIESRPRHLGTSVRRKVIRKKVIPQITTTISTTSTTTTTTTPAPTFRSVADFWNNNDPWKSFRYEPVNRGQSNPTTLNPPTTIGPKHISSIRRTIPKFENRQRFERKPVLRDESEDANERINDDDDDDDYVVGRNFVYNTPEIVRNKNSSHRLHMDDDLLLPKNKVKDVSNNINSGGGGGGGGVRFKPVNPRPVTPSTITTTTTTTTTTTAHGNRRNNNRNNNQNLNNAFDAGFRHAILPINRPISSSLQHQPPPPPPPLPSSNTDIEYEDLENEDEDEDVDDIGASDHDDDNNNFNNRSNDENSNNQSLNNNNNNNREIIVRYDDDADDNNHHHHLDATRRRQLPSNHHQFINNSNNNNHFLNNNIPIARNIASQSPNKLTTRIFNDDKNINTFVHHRLPSSTLNNSVGYGQKILTTTTATTTTTTTTTITPLTTQSVESTKKQPTLLAANNGEKKSRKSKIFNPIVKPTTTTTTRTESKLPVINNSTTKIRKILKKISLQNQPNKITTTKIKRQESKIRKQNNTILIENSKHVSSSSSLMSNDTNSLDKNVGNNSQSNNNRQTIKSIGNTTASTIRLNESKNITNGNNSSTIANGHTSGNKKTSEIGSRNHNKVNLKKSNKSNNKSKDRTSKLKPKTDGKKKLDNDPSRPVARFFFGSNQGRKRFQINVPDKEWRTFDVSSQSISSSSSKSLIPVVRPPTPQRILTFVPKYENF